MPTFLLIIVLITCTCLSTPVGLHAADTGSTSMQQRRDGPTPQDWKNIQRLPHAVPSRAGRGLVAGAAAAAAAGSFYEEHPAWTAFFALLAIAMVGSAISEWLKKSPGAGDSAAGPVTPVTATAPIATVDPTIPGPAAPTMTFGAMLLRDLRSVAIKIAIFIGIVVTVFGGMWLLVVLLR